MKTYNRIARCILATVILLGRDIVAGSPLSTKELVYANNTFALDLYARLAQEPGNFIVSPFSIDMAIAMTYAGARGETAQQITKALHLSKEVGDVHAGFAALLKTLNETDTSNCHLILANSIWGQQGYPFKRAFRQTVRDQYGAGLEVVNFQASPDTARQQINAWIATQTQNRIHEMIESGLLDSQTLLVLVNAVYFKGNWAKVFEETQTKAGPFQLRVGESVTVPIMNQAGRYRYAETSDLEVLELPYGDIAGPAAETPNISNRFSMVVLLPKKIDGLLELEQTLSVTQLVRLQNESRVRELIVSLPRFKVGSTFDLRGTLQAMGMSDAFSAVRADFAGISGEKPLFISLVCHRAWVDVDENGTEATAATAIRMTRGGYDPYSPAFNANHPFLFLIRHNLTGTILFLGRVANPKS